MLRPYREGGGGGNGFTEKGAEEELQRKRMKEELYGGGWRVTNVKERQIWSCQISVRGDGEGGGGST